MNRILYTFAFFGLLVILASCTGDIANIPERYCSITELLLEPSDYPDGINLGEINSPLAEQPAESAGQSGNYLGSLIFQNVIRYKSEDRAVEQYDEWKQTAFRENSLKAGSWEAPSIVAMNGFSANQIHIACGNTITGEECRMIGQYEEYFVYYAVDTLPEYGISQEVFLDLVVKIDNRISSCINFGK
jgi:hypothetical protein